MVLSILINLYNMQLIIKNNIKKYTIIKNV